MDHTVIAIVRELSNRKCPSVHSEIKTRVVSINSARALNAQEGVWEVPPERQLPLLPPVNNEKQWINQGPTAKQS